MPSQFAEPTISAALSRAINQVPDDGLKLKVDILVAKTARALAAARSIQFAGYEDREMQEHSLELWNELAPRFGAVFKELNALVDAALDLFPSSGKPATAEDDLLEAAFGPSAARTPAPVPSSPKSPHDAVTELIQNFAWILKRDIQDEMKKLREPALMQQQVNLLGELEGFRDKVVGGMHAMVASVLGVFDDVEVETLYPQANERIEMAVSMRRQVADLVEQVESHVAALRDAPPPAADVRGMLGSDEERTGQILQLNAVGTLRAADRVEMARFRREAMKLRQAAKLDLTGARHLLDGFSKFLSSVQTMELTELLQSHDQEVALEAVQFLTRAEQVIEQQPAQGLLLLAHAGRRVSRLYGVHPGVDSASKALRELAGKAVDIAEVRQRIDAMLLALESFAAG